jgi:hypothetical protein
VFPIGKARAGFTKEFTLLNEPLKKAISLSIELPIFS